MGSHIRRHHENLDVSSGPSQKTGHTQVTQPSLNLQGQVKLTAMLSWGSFGAKYPSQSPIAMTITEQIALLIIKDLRPYSIVEGSEFIVRGSQQ